MLCRSALCGYREWDKLLQPCVVSLQRQILSYGLWVLTQSWPLSSCHRLGAVCPLLCPYIWTSDLKRSEASCSQNILLMREVSSVVSLLLQFYSRVSFLWKLRTPLVCCFHTLSVLDLKEMLIPLEVAYQWQEVFFHTFPASPLVFLVCLLPLLLIPLSDPSWPCCSWFALSLRGAVSLKKKVASS